MTEYNYCLCAYYVSCFILPAGLSHFIETTQLLNIQALITKVTNAQSNKTAVNWCPTAETHMDKRYVSGNFHSG